MKFLKAKIEEWLLEICENVYLDTAEDDSKFPYLVYSLGVGVNIQGLMTYPLMVDIWDKNTTTVNIDELQSKLKGLDKATYIDDKIQFTLHFDRLIPSGSHKDDWQRYTAVFNVRCIERI